MPLFLVDVKYEDEISVRGEWADSNDPGRGKKWTKDEGEGDFSGTAVSQAEFTSPSLLALWARLYAGGRPAPSPRVRGRLARYAPHLRLCTNPNPNPNPIPNPYPNQARSTPSPSS